MDRSLHISAMVAADLDQKLNALEPKLKARKGAHFTRTITDPDTGPAIVYATLQKQAETVMQKLQSRGIQCEMYHAGMKNEKRQGGISQYSLFILAETIKPEVQEWFMASDAGLVCATIAFAMGIDKNNIRQIHHLMMPKSLENWT